MKNQMLILSLVASLILTMSVAFQRVNTPIVYDYHIETNEVNDTTLTTLWINGEVVAHLYPIDSLGNVVNYHSIIIEGH